MYELTLLMCLFLLFVLSVMGWLRGGDSRKTWLSFDASFSPRNDVQTPFLVSVMGHSPLGEVSLYRWCPVLQVWLQLLDYIPTNNHIFSFWLKSSLVKLETCHTYPTESVLSLCAHIDIFSIIRFLTCWSRSMKWASRNFRPRDQNKIFNQNISHSL